MYKLIKTKAYGTGKWISYDARFPGYFSGIFDIRGHKVTIDNLKKSDIISVTETENCLSLVNQFLGLSNDEHCWPVTIEAGYRYDLEREHFFTKQVSNDIEYHDVYRVNKQIGWWDENEIDEVFDLTNKFIKFSY